MFRDLKQSGLMERFFKITNDNKFELLFRKQTIDNCHFFIQDYMIIFLSH